MRLADQNPPARVPDNWQESIWPAFEADVLQYVDRGCELLQDDARRRASWTERHFTWALVRHLEQIREDRWEYLSPRYDAHHLSDEDFAEGNSPLAAPLIDLVIRWNYREPDPHFAVEAKILVSSMVGNYAPGRTVEEYVASGIKRFVDGKYAGDFPTAAMLGFILAGAPAELAIKINAQIAEATLPCESLLSVRSAEPPSRQWYDSKHPRPAGTTIVIHHALVVFDSIMPQPNP